MQPSHSLPAGSALDRALGAAWLPVALCALHAALLVASAMRHSGVVDEVAVHIPAGALYWQSGEWNGGLGNPPLGALWIALPNALAAGDYAPFAEFGERGLLLFRAPVILLGVALGWVLHGFARALAGPRAAAVALLLWALSPNLLAHGSVATLDLPIAFCILATLAAARRCAHDPSAGAMLLAGLAAGAALCTKVQGVVALPLAMLGIALARGPALGVAPIAALGRWALLVAPGFVLLHLVYGSLPGGEGLLPAGFVDASLRKLQHAERGHVAYLMGEWSTQGWWWYFPAAIALKTPLPTLVLAALGIALRPSRALLVWAALPAALLVALAMSGSVDIGLRHVLPAYPFLLVLAGAGFSVLSIGRARRAAALALLALYCVETLSASAHPLAYFSWIFGGTTAGHRYLLDSNLDWGQHDLALRRYVDARPAAGRPDAICPDAFQPRGGRILVGASALHGILNGGPRAYTWLRDREPVARPAVTWFEFDVPRAELPLASADELRRRDARTALALHVRALFERLPSRAGPRIHLRAARLAERLRDHAFAFERVRAALRLEPAHRAAFYLASELSVRRKLGVLAFEGREYLEGFAAPRPPPAAPARAQDLARLAAQLELAPSLASLHAAIGEAHAASGDRAAALRGIGLALEIDPAQGRAAAQLALLQAGSAAERGAFAEAQRIALVGARRAEKEGLPELASRLRQRAARYASGAR